MQPHVATIRHGGVCEYAWVFWVCHQCASTCLVDPQVMRILDRGTSAIQSILGTVVFSIGPQLIDIVTGSVTIGLVLQPAIAVIVCPSLNVQPASAC